MSLSSALAMAKSSLSATSKQTSLVARNIAGANDPNYSKRIGSLSSGQFGSINVSVNRAADEALLGRLMQASSDANRSSTLGDGLNRLSAIFSAEDYARSPTKLIGALEGALQVFANAPSDQLLGDSVVSKAQSLAHALNDGSNQIQKLRSDADQQIADVVSNVNDLLSKFEKANQNVVNGSRSGKDISEALDQRDSILKLLSAELGISTITRSDNDMVIVSSNGSVLFEKVPRNLTFTPAMGLAPGTAGNMVYLDGVPLDHDSFEQPFGTGKLSGLLQIRDQIAPQYQLQLDEIARGLVTAFSESDPAGTGAAKTGLFSYAGSPDVPGNAHVRGLASTLRVSSAFIASEGGSSLALRDGLHYKYNESGAAAFNERLLSLKAELSKPMDFSTGSGQLSRSSLTDYGTTTISWLEGQRKSVDSTLRYHGTVLQQSETALSNRTGVDTDTEMALLLELEHSYQASTRVLTTVNAMLDDLLRAV